MLEDTAKDRELPSNGRLLDASPSQSFFVDPNLIAGYLEGVNSEFSHVGHELSEVTPICSPRVLALYDIAEPGDQSRRRVRPANRWDELGKKPGYPSRASEVTRHLDRMTNQATPRNCR